MAKAAKSTAKKEPKKMSRSGDPDIDLAKARSLDDDTANDDAELDVDEVEAQDSDEPGPAAKEAVAGHVDADADNAERTPIEGAEFSVSTSVSEANGDVPETRKHYGKMVLRSSEGEEVEFSVNNVATARQIANAFSALADELTRRRM
jgi:hypothetical protein